MWWEGLLGLWLWEWKWEWEWEWYVFSWAASSEECEGEAPSEDSGPATGSSEGERDICALVAWDVAELFSAVLGGAWVALALPPPPPPPPPRPSSLPSSLLSPPRSRAPDTEAVPPDTAISTPPSEDPDVASHSNDEVRPSLQSGKTMICGRKGPVGLSLAQHHSVNLLFTRSRPRVADEENAFWECDVDADADAETEAEVEPGVVPSLATPLGLELLVCVLELLVE